MTIKSVLSSFWDKWKKFGQFLGDLFARVVLTILFFTLMVPFGIGMRIFGDPFKLKENDSTYWDVYPTIDSSLFDSRRQF
ncbi:MAG TPA: hypothetical protein DCL76_06140 [Chloroflexi bacterium]|nr:hypothetical protein [Chloroflexota bacterium]HCU99187.1 hypothetical protein [Chloroflexota bacterium]|tara:strand:+ start:402 stop:641 length:240 start_codon:yes stop_codon:yes gene_type:complete